MSVASSVAVAPVTAPATRDGAMCRVLRRRSAEQEGRKNVIPVVGHEKKFTKLVLLLKNFDRSSVQSFAQIYLHLGVVR